MNNGKIPESLYPDLIVETKAHGFGHFLAEQLIGNLIILPDPKVHILIITFIRLVDGALLDYSTARQSHYAFHNEPALGSKVPISKLLVPYHHHIENCLTNTLRAISVGKSVRRLIPPIPNIPLIEKDEWKLVSANEAKIRGIRDSVQHSEKMLLKGELTTGGIEFRAVTGEIAFGSNVLTIVALAETLRTLRGITEITIKRLRREDSLIY